MNWFYIVVGILVVVSLAKLIQGFMYPQAAASNNGMFNFVFLITGLLAGIGAAFLISKKSFLKSNETRVESSVMLNKIEKVFKVVTAEGHFSEVFDYSQTSKFAAIIPSTKKALLIVNAKVLMGYDFKKLKMELDPENNTIKILEFPKPEVMSIEPDIKYYNIYDATKQF